MIINKLEVINKFTIPSIKEELKNYETGLNKLYKKDLVELLYKYVESDEISILDIMGRHKEDTAYTTGEVEDFLGITKYERQKWTRNKKLNVVKTKYYMGMNFPCYDPIQVYELYNDKSIIEQMRNEDLETAEKNRREGAKKAAISRVVNKPERERRKKLLLEEEKARQEREEREKEREMRERERIINEIIADFEAKKKKWSILEEKKASIVELSFWTMQINHWAKRNQEYARLYKYYGEGDDSWISLEKDYKTDYEYKRQALELLSKSEFAKLFYIPSNRFKMWVNYQKNKYEIDNHYYDLFLVEICVDDNKFSYHIPFSMGEKFILNYKELEVKESNENQGEFRYGRPISYLEEEVFTHDLVCGEFMKAFERCKKIMGEIAA